MVERLSRPSTAGNSLREREIEDETIGKESVRTNCLIAAIAIAAGGILILTAHAQEIAPFKFDLTPANDTIAACLPHAAVR
jgi:hypothetical protein